MVPRLRSIDVLKRANEARKARGDKVVYLSPIEKAKTDPTSRAKAIVAKCYDCIGQDADPAWKWRVGNCECKDCPLYAVRPHKRLEGTPIPVALRVDREVQG